MIQIVAKKSLYESDYLRWTQEIVAKLRTRDFEHLDIENLIEEIEDLGRSQRKELESRLATLLAHLLKRMYINMPDCYNGWQNTITEQRIQIEVLLNNYPSLKSYWDEHFSDAWLFALKHTRKEYQPKGFIFPNIWELGRDIDTMLNVNFWE